MSWQLHHRGDSDKLMSFLKVKEWGHVGFSWRVAQPQETAQTIYVNKNEMKDGPITEAILYTSSGLLIPVLAHKRPARRYDIHRLFSETSSSAGGYGKPRRLKKLHTIMGTRQDVETFQEILDARCYASVDYHIMTSTETPSIRTCRDGVVCKVARTRNTKLLYPLQKAYEIEEVLLDPSRFSPQACLLALQKNLSKELVLFALVDGKAIAKAGTNARGFAFAQLGGVYTAKDHRNRGIGALVLSLLLERIEASGKKASLFVKKDNPAAIHLYKKLSFRVRGDFRIVYYR